MKRFLALVVFVVMVATSVLAVAEEPRMYKGLNIEKRLSFEMVGWSNNDLTGEDPVYKVLEEKLNIDFKYTCVPVGEYENFVNMRIASGDIPMMFKTKYPDASACITYRQLLDDGIITNISPYVEEYGLDNLKARLDADYSQPFSEPDGFYMVPNFLGPDLAGMYIRRDWMDKLGLEDPTTYEEYKQVLRAIVDADPDGNGTTGLTLPGLDFLKHIFAAFTGEAGDWVNYNGEWTHRIFVPGFKEAIIYLADLYSEGLLDPEFVMLNNSTAQAKITEGKAASLLLNGTLSWYTSMTESLQVYNADAKLGFIVPWPAGPSGSLKESGAQNYGAVHFNADYSPEEIARGLALLDYTLSDECEDLFFYGLEGIHHEVVDGKKQFITENRRRDFFSSTAMYPLWDLINNDSQWKYNENPDMLENREFAYVGGVAPDVIGLANEKTAELGPNLTDVYEKWVVNFITGNADIETQWEEFLNEFKASGCDEYLVEVANYVNNK